MTVIANASLGFIGNIDHSIEQLVNSTQFGTSGVDRNAGMAVSGNNLYVSGVENGHAVVRLYDISSGKVVKTWPVGRVARLTADAKTFVRVDNEFATISVGDAATGTVAGTLAIRDSPCEPRLRTRILSSICPRQT